MATETKYWFNKNTGEYAEHWKDPTGHKDFGSGQWTPAPQSYVDNINQEKTLQQDKTAQATREKDAVTTLREVIDMYGPKYNAGMKKTALAAANAKLIQSGLGGTTRAAAVSGGIASTFEDMRMGKLMEAMNNLSGFLGSYRDPYGTTPSNVLQSKGQGQQFDLSKAGLNLQAQGQENQFMLGSRGLNLQAHGQKNQFALGQAGLGLQAQGQQNQFATSNRSLGLQQQELQQNLSGNAENVWNNPSLRDLGVGGNNTTGNMLGDFDPAAANARLGNTVSQDNWGGAG